VLTTEIRRLHASLVLLQYPDDLLFAVSALFHPLSSRSDYERTPVLAG
jgi:diphthamide synthase subunit DPH2